MAKRMRHVQAAIAVIERQGRYLLSRRRLRGHLAGLWEFPGGKRRVGETWVACLHRELLEELGIKARILRRLKPLRFRYENHQAHLAVFRCTIIQGRPKPLASLQLRWMNPDQLSRCRVPPANRPLVRRLTLHGPSARAILRSKRRFRR